MAEVKLPRFLGECRRCGEPLEIVDQRATVLPGEVVIDFTPRCTGWCDLLSEGPPDAA